MGRLHHRERRTKLRREARTKPVKGHFDYGDGKDAGKYYRCWNCGFVCDIDRDQLGGRDEPSRVSSKAYDLVGEDSETLVKDTNNSSDYSIFGGTAYRRTRYEPEVSSGCPMCGTLNWRGDNP